MSDGPARFAVLGDALLDVAVGQAAALVPGGDVPATIRIGPGGQGANVAVRLARLGAEVLLSTTIGRDRAGDLVRSALLAEGVRLATSSSAATGSVVVITDPSGERTMLSQRIPFGERVRLPAASEWVIVSGYPLVEPAGERLASAITTLDARRIVLGCAVLHEVRDRWAAAVRALRPDLAILNRDEAASLLAADADAPAELAAAAAVFLRCAAIVTDATGAVAVIGGGDPIVVRAPRAQPPIDTTGAGDAFAACLLVGIARGRWPPPRKQLEAALAAATLHAAAVTRVVGAQGRVEGERVPAAVDDGSLDA